MAISVLKSDFFNSIFSICCDVVSRLHLNMIQLFLKDLSCVKKLTPRHPPPNHSAQMQLGSRAKRAYITYYTRGLAGLKSSNCTLCSMYDGCMEAEALLLAPYHASMNQVFFCVNFTKICTYYLY